MCLKINLNLITFALLFDKCKQEHPGIRTDICQMDAL